MKKLSLKVLACEVAWREISLLAARSPHILSVEFLPVGHHDDPVNGRKVLQERIQQTTSHQYDAILLGYGLCNQMLNGLSAVHLPLIIPRAHDCLTLFLGSRKRYQDLFNACPGAFYFTAGWLDFSQLKALRKEGLAAFQQTPEDTLSQPSVISNGQTYAQMVEKYGEDNAKYLMEIAQQWTHNYQVGAYIRYDFNDHLGLRERAQSICQRYNWRYEEHEGSLDLLQRWLSGQWEGDDFLRVEPGQTIQPSNDEQIIVAKGNA
jgi:hypothetical protein